MEPHAVRGIPDAVTGNSVAVTEFSVTATVPPGRPPVPEPASSAPLGSLRPFRPAGHPFRSPPPLRRLAAKPAKIPSPDVRAMRVRAAAIAQEPETGGENGKSKSSLELSRQNQ